MRAHFAVHGLDGIEPPTRHSVKFRELERGDWFRFLVTGAGLGRWSPDGEQLCVRLADRSDGVGQYFYIESGLEDWRAPSIGRIAEKDFEAPVELLRVGIHAGRSEIR